VRLEFRNEAHTVSRKIEFSTAVLTPTPVDFEAEKEKSTLFSIDLPAGNYVIESLRFAGGGDLYGKPCVVRSKFAVPFTVKAGTATYLGSLLASADWAPNHAGLMAPICGYFVVNDRSERDEALIRQKIPNLTLPFETRLLSANSDTARNFFRSE
jgi:hypothetical protein